MERRQCWFRSDGRVLSFPAIPLTRPEARREENNSSDEREERLSETINCRSLVIIIVCTRYAVTGPPWSSIHDRTRVTVRHVPYRSTHPVRFHYFERKRSVARSCKPVVLDLFPFTSPSSARIQHCAALPSKYQKVYTLEEKHK